MLRKAPFTSQWSCFCRPGSYRMPRYLPCSPLSSMCTSRLCSSALSSTGASLSLRMSCCGTAYSGELLPALWAHLAACGSHQDGHSQCSPGLAS